MSEIRWMLGGEPPEPAEWPQKFPVEHVDNTGTSPDDNPKPPAPKKTPVAERDVKK